MQLLRSRESSDVLNYAEIATEDAYVTFDLWIFIHNSFHNLILDSKSLLLQKIMFICQIASL